MPYIFGSAASSASACAAGHLPQRAFLATKPIGSIVSTSALHIVYVSVYLPTRACGSAASRPPPVKAPGSQLPLEDDVFDFDLDVSGSHLTRLVGL